MLAGWLGAGLDPKAVIAIDPSPPADSVRLLSEAGIVVRTSVPAAAVRVLLVAVKPQAMADILPGLKPLVAPDSIVLSIAAGKSIASFEAAFGDVAVVRSMPNTPAQVGRSITAAVGNARVTIAERALVSALLEAVGEVAWLDDEGLIDVVTAISGSGPAYVFNFVEALAAAGEDLGLPPELAIRFARATVVGAGELLHRSALPPAELRKNVTSPGGTTAAALGVLMGEEGLAPLVLRAATAAKRRSVELSG